MPETARQKVDLVLEGGGVKGIGLVGALAVLEERGFQPQNVAGTSAGAIAAVLIAAGYTAAELRSILSGLDFDDFMDEGWEDRIPLVRRPLSVVKDLGVFEGLFFLAWIRELLAAKGVETFADLVHPDFASEERYRYRAQVIASDLTAKELLVLPRDARRFGVEPDDVEVAEAVRMSMSIPVFFEPWLWQPEGGGPEHVIVDGGMLSNFPVWLFDSGGEPEWPTFGLMLVEPKPREQVGERLPETAGEFGLIDYAKSLVQTMLEAHDRMYLETASFVRTIGVPTLGVRTTEFDLSPERTDALYESGRQAATDFLKDWDFEAYKAGFRDKKKAPGRTELIKAAVGTS